MIKAYSVVWLPASEPVRSEGQVRVSMSGSFREG
jgi:hypothetical protein